MIYPRDLKEDGVGSPKNWITLTKIFNIYIIHSKTYWK